MTLPAEALQDLLPDKIVHCVECGREIVVLHFIASGVELGFISDEGRCFTCCCTDSAITVMLEKIKRIFFVWSERDGQLLCYRKLTALLAYFFLHIRCEHCGKRIHWWQRISTQGCTGARFAHLRCSQMWERERDYWRVHDYLGWGGNEQCKAADAAWAATNIMFQGIRGPTP